MSEDVRSRRETDRGERLAAWFVGSFAHVSPWFALQVFALEGALLLAGVAVGRVLASAVASSAGLTSSSLTPAPALLGLLTVLLIFAGAGLGWRVDHWFRQEDQLPAALAVLGAVLPFAVAVLVLGVEAPSAASGAIGLGVSGSSLIAVLLPVIWSVRRHHKPRA